MKRIICTVTNDLSHDQRMIRICGSLQEAGYAVTLVGRALPDSPALVRRTFRQHRLRCWFVRGKLFYLEFQIRLLFFLLRQEVEVINAVDLDTLLAGYLISRWRKIPCVYDAHEYFTETPEVVRRPLVQKVWSMLADWVIPQLSHCYTVGPALAKVLSTRYGVPFGVVRNVPLRNELAQADALTIAESAQPKVLLYQGMLNEGRGLEVAIATMAILPPDFVLWLVGKGDIIDALQVQVAELGLAKRVRFWGFMPPAELPDMTAQAWLGLNLLEAKGLSYYYSLANKAFDYQQADLPAVHMDFPEYRALNEEWGGLLLLADLAPESLAALVRQLAEQPDQYDKLQEANRKAATELHWEREEVQLLAIYEQLGVEP